MSPEEQLDGQFTFPSYGAFNCVVDAAWHGESYIDSRGIPTTATTSSRCWRRLLGSLRGGEQVANQDEDRQEVDGQEVDGQEQGAYRPNEAIVDALKAGTPADDMAEKYALSKIRVKQIAWQAKTGRIKIA